MIDLPFQDNHGPDDSIDQPRVSVLMPCYNAEETIDETMESLCGQTLTACEFVIVDDGSQDSTVERLQVWAARDARVRLIGISHTGIIEALNTGIAACRAELIARMDADDLARPERLKSQADFLDQHPEVAAVGCLVEGFPSHNVREGFKIYIAWLNSMVTPEEIARGIFIESPLAHPSVIIRRNWLERMGGYQENGWPEDYDLWLRMHLDGARFAKVPEVLLEWREHPRRLTRTDSRYSVENFLRAKARYLAQGPLNGRDAVIVWGAGQMGRRLSKHLEREGAPLVAFVDIDPKKIGSTRRGKPIIAAQDLLSWWRRFERPILLASVGSRGARALIRNQLVEMGLGEGVDWWAVA
jgi:glycosyltransferase involved in cell wall biosynthesis